MNCDKCGKSNSAQAKFCGKCGFTLKALVAEDQVLVAQESVDKKTEPVAGVEKEAKLNQESTRQTETVGVASSEQSVARKEGLGSSKDFQHSSRSATPREQDPGLEDDGSSMPSGLSNSTSGFVSPASLNITGATSTPLTSTGSIEPRGELTQGSNPPSEDLKSLINSQFNNNYSNQAAIKKYLDAHTEQLKSITFQLESIKNFQATINYELIINKINDKYNAITQSINEKFFSPNFKPSEEMDSLLSDVDDKTHFLFEKINSLLLSHNQQLMNNFQSVIQNIDHQNASVYELVQDQFSHKNEELAQTLKSVLTQFESTDVVQNINFESRLLDHITEIKQQNIDANRTTQERIQALETSLQGVGQIASPETSTQTVDLIAKHIKSQALTSVEKISTLMSNNNKAMSNVVTAEIGQLLEQKLQALKSDLQSNLLDFETQVKLDQEKLSSLLNQSGKIDQLLKLKVSSSSKVSQADTPSDPLGTPELDKNTIITFATGLLCGFTVLLGGMGIYNLAFKDDFTVHSAHQVTETRSIKHEPAQKSLEKSVSKSVEKAEE